MMLNRRQFFTATAAAALFPALMPKRSHAAGFEVTKSDAEWHKILTPAQFAVLRDHDTEKPFGKGLLGESSPLIEEHRAGTYTCAGCALPVYDAATKFDSGTGWPSFYAAIKGSVGTMEDDTLFSARTEVHCRRCGGHLGHVFSDGPQPTGKRYCMNGLAMKFSAA